MRTLVATMLFLGLAISPATAQTTTLELADMDGTTMWQLVQLDRDQQYLFVRATLETRLMLANADGRGDAWNSCLKRMANDQYEWLGQFAALATFPPDDPIVEESKNTFAVVYIAIQVELGCFAYDKTN